MKISDILQHTKRSVSFEFFPPKTPEGEDSLFRTIKDLEFIKPTFVSVTYGAGGSTRERTIRIVKKIHTETKLTVMAHQTCIGHTKNEIVDILKEYRNIGVQNVLALRGDIPEGQKESFVFPPDGCRYANELVSLIRENFGDWFSIGVAAYPEGHPESPDLDTDIFYFKKKVDAGAEFAITQMFFDNRYFYNFVEKVQKVGIDIPIIPGIMPVTNFKQIKKFADMCGATIPKELIEKIQPVADRPEEVEKIGIEYAVKQCEDLLKHGVKGLHFYTLNKSKATIQIYNQIKDLI
ncbi:5,10-methylenetetrahydrofolate reductase (NAD(P)) [Persephonella hydrogeniphila]|uniref:Methylenetetrahydrofolate reductase n=1 Tax=Persephonella hydrogeniphila TaxID=198703 RepID=A0A285NL83_9AQUI|nr:methylenetetrahydrofolate reductase [NAD(P)H] [Persephonella hydrogeniphila]SNZ09683.1 5,10-methylenetetrahydrofolate reductase (NAD(P)) [Persephonella hydrogeniphila]